MYKVGIIGGGISGLMTAYRLIEKNPNVEVIIFEKGHDILNRKCPILTKKVSQCIKCKNCAIMEGLAGAGAFSDGKYNITTEFGGWLQDIRESEEVINYIEQADSILVKFGATTDRFMPSNELKKLCLQHDLHMLQSQCKHLGTDANFETMVKMIGYLNEHSQVKIMTNCEVVDVTDAVSDNTKVILCNVDGNPKTIYVDKVVFAVGRVGSKFFSDWCNANGVSLTNNQVDIGVRVELPAMIWEDFEKKIYEPKIHYTSKKYGDTTRMFCFNGRGEVVTENANGVLTVNGHAYKAEDKKTENTNFALLSTIRFTQPFNKPIEYARHVASLANMISGGSVLVQRLGDLELGRRTDESRLRKSTVKPTLKGAVAGLMAGIVYSLVEKKNRTVAVIVAAIVTPIVNTGLFLLGCSIFFMDTITQWAAGAGFESAGAYMIGGLVGLNFLIEMAVNIVLNPVIIRILDIVKKPSKANA